MKATKITNVNLVVKSFSKAGQLKGHIYTIHEGHKDYKCESCDKSFSQAGQLNGQWTHPQHSFQP